MKKTFEFLNKYDILNFGKNNKIMLFLTFFLIVGMILGSLAVGFVSLEAINKLDFLLSSDFKERITQSLFEVFISSFSATFIFVALLEFFALSFWGIVLIPLLMIFRGLGLGISVGYLYLIYGLKGIAFYILVLLPGIFASSIGLVMFSTGALEFSHKYAKKLLSNADSEPLWGRLISQLKKSGYCLVMLLISAALDAIFTFLFSRFFEF